ncbi:MAG TPA: hypothetical protein VJP88_08285 [Caulobacteraceae bacterium]|nr:hypothetical protein [Caulobacteraceae bacterium]
MAHPDFDIDEPDPQDVAETLDETHLNEDEDEFTTLEEVDDVLDVTEAAGDADDDEALDEADFDPDAIDDDAIEDDELEDRPDAFQPEDSGADDEDEAAVVEDRLGADDIEGLDQVADADLVEGGEDDFTNFQSKTLSDQEITALGYASKAKPRPAALTRREQKPGGSRPEHVKDERDPHVEENLDHGVEETFPASDPVSISPGAD